MHAVASTTTNDQSSPLTSRWFRGSFAKITFCHFFHLANVTTVGYATPQQTHTRVCGTVAAFTHCTRALLAIITFVPSHFGRTATLAAVLNRTVPLVFVFLTIRHASFLRLAGLGMDKLNVGFFKPNFTIAYCDLVGKFRPAGRV